jgi:uncharacterized protein HemX
MKLVKAEDYTTKSFTISLENVKHGSVSMEMPSLSYTLADLAQLQQELV